LGLGSGKQTPRARQNCRSALDLRAPNARTERHETSATRRAITAHLASLEPVRASLNTDGSADPALCALRESNRSGNLYAVTVLLSWQGALLSLVVLIALWLVFLAFLVVARPDTGTLRGLPRMLPDTLRWVGRLARDRGIPRSARLPAWALLSYLAMPIDLVPDFLPVIGYADDAILTAFVLHRLLRKAGPTKLTEHWPGTPEGLATLSQMLHLEPS
jgi:uncharacterized membrane protein YkvA (DUF1232 family)